MIDPLRKHGLNKVVGLGVHAAAGDKVDFKDIRNAAIDITVDMFIDSCAQKLGVEYKLEQIDYLTHKFGHFGVGAFKGAISNLIQGERVLEGALVGGAAAAGAEILGEKLIKVQEIRNEVIQEAIDERRPIVGDEYIAEVNKRLAQQTDFIKIAMAGVAAIAGQNPHLGADCAANALENNFLAHIVGGAAGGLAVALEAAGVVEAGAVANVIWGALGTGILITGCQVAQENLPGSSPFEESPWINGPPIIGTPITDKLPDLEGYQPAPQDYDTTITITPVADTIGENEGYQAAPQDVLNYKLPGFTPVDVPDTFILMNEGGGNVVGKDVKVHQVLRDPSSLQDEMILEAAKRGEGRKLPIELNDPRFKGMEKWEYKVKSATGKDSVVHYVRDPKTGQLMDFKFKKRSTD